MKKFVSIGTAALMALSLAACSSSSASSTASASAAATASASASAETQTVGQYTLYNATGDSVTDLYLYETGSSDKGENLAGDKGFSKAHAKYVTYDAGSKAADTKLTLEFTTKGGYTGSFTTLSIETAPISLIAEDAKTGATAISFAATPATYTITNATGEEVTDLYIYATGSSDKGKNLIDGAAQADGTQTVTYDSVPTELITTSGIGSFTIEFTTKSGYTGTFTTLSYEVANINLIAESAKTGATAIQFGY